MKPGPPRRPFKPAPPAFSARAAAQRVFHDWSQSQRHAADLIARVQAERPLPHADHALLLDLVLTVLRHLSLLDHWIAQLTSDRPLDDPTRWLLRAALAELLILGIAPHAAVNENVNLGGRAGGLINAVLRRACREKDSLLSQADALPLHLRHSHPPFLLQRWEKHFGPSDTAALAAWNQQPAPVFVRLNRLHPDAESSLPQQPGLEPIGHDFYRCQRLPLEALNAGHCYAQDPSTALAPSLAAPQPGHTVLDACAAPGGKTALLAQAMRNEGRLIATDLPGPRLRRLQENLARLRVTCAEVHPHDWLAPGPAPDWLPAEGFDLILLDAPCSNTGVMRRRVDVRWRLTEAEFTRMIDLQRQLVESLLPHLKPGGRLVYSTCSIDPEENDAQIDHLLRAHPRLQLETTATRLPHRDHTDGAYTAVLRTPA